MSVGGIDWNKQSPAQIKKGIKLLSGWQSECKEALAWLRKVACSNLHAPAAKHAIRQLEFWLGEIEADQTKLAFRKAGYTGPALR